MGKCKRDCSSSSSEPGYKKKERRRHRKFNVQNECQTSVTSLSSSSSSSSCSSSSRSGGHRRKKYYTFYVEDVYEKKYNYSKRVGGKIWSITTRGKSGKRGGTLKTLKLKKGWYKFKVRSGQRDEYGAQEFYLTTDPLGGSKNRKYDLTKRVSYGTLKFHVNKRTPVKFYYQSSAGICRGGKVVALHKY